MLQILLLIVTALTNPVSSPQHETFGAGGPDAYGYRWIDNDTSAPNIPIFQWKDISSVGTQVTGLADDNVVGPFPIGFSFPYYWYRVNSFYIGSNGYIAFGDNYLSAHPFQNLPSPARPNNIVAALMSDLDFSVGSPACYYWTNPAQDTCIISYVNVRWWNVPTSCCSFQIILSRPDSSITFQYKKIQGVPYYGGWYAGNNTIGIENITGTIGLAYLHGAVPSINIPHDNLVVKFYPLIDEPPPTAAWIIMNNIPNPYNKNVKAGGGLVPADNKIYAFKGNNTQEFYAYNIGNNTWVTKCMIPKGINKKQVKAGAALCYDGISSIYALKGGNTLEFWEYDIDNDTWTRMRDVPLGANKKIKGGSGLVYASKPDSSFVFCLKASNTQEFYAYYLQGDTWLKRKDAPLGLSGKGFDKGSCITYNGNDTIFALKGKFNEFYAYSVTQDTWITRQPMPMNSIYGRNKKAKDGASLTYHPDGIVYALKGGNTQEFWAYDVNTNNWTVKETIPKGPSKKKIGAGGSLCYAMGHIYALKGNNTLEFWRYTPGAELTGKTVPGIMSQPTKMIYPFMLYQNTPNPFKSVTAIRYSLPTETKVSLQIFDVSGRLIKTLVNESKGPGVYTVNWNGTDENNRLVKSGVYFYILKTDNNKTQRKMLLFK